MGDVGGGEGIGEVGKCAWPIRVCFSATQTAVIAAEPFIWCPPARPPAAVTSALESGLSLGTISFHSVLRNTIIIIAHDARVM